MGVARPDGGGYERDRGQVRRAGGHGPAPSGRPAAGGGHLRAGRGAARGRVLRHRRPAADAGGHHPAAAAWRPRPGMASQAPGSARTPAARSGCRSAGAAAGCPANSPTWSAGTPVASRSSAIARVTTRRQRQILLGRHGESLAEVAADDVHAQILDGTAAESRWHEVEVELTGGDRRLLKAADARLRRDGLRPARASAKLERALGGRLPAPAGERPLAPSSPAGPGGAGLPAGPHRKAHIA